MFQANAFSDANYIGRISFTALRAIAHVATMRAIAHVATMRAIAHVTAMRAIAHVTAMRAIAHVTTMRAIAHVTTMCTDIKLLNDVDVPVPRASQCRPVPLALRVVLAPYDVQRARPFKARHAVASQVVPPQIAHLQQRQLIHPQASDSYHESSSRGSAMTFGSVLRPPLARRSTPSQLM